jgi:DME family drug/metabolite transporter
MPVGVLLIGLASISWGTTGATMTLLAKVPGIGPLLVGWARLAVAAPCLLLAAVFADFVATGRRPVADARVIRAGNAWARREFPLYALLGVAMASYQACYFSAVTLTGVAVAALLAICSAPLLIAILAALVLGERPPPMVRLSLGMAVAGTALLTVGPRGLGQISGHFGLGSLLALGAGASYAAYTVTAKGVLSRVPPLTVSAMTFTLAAVFLAPALLGERPPLGAVATAWPLLLYLGVGPTAVAYVLFTAGLRRVPATVAGIVSLLEPLTATTLGVVAFGESLGALGFAGAILLLTSLGLLVATNQKTIRSTDSRPG